MNRINNLFSTKQKDILSIYFCAGYPTSDGTANVINTLASKGIDMIEIGIPFSDTTTPFYATEGYSPQSTDSSYFNGIFKPYHAIRLRKLLPYLQRGWYRRSYHSRPSFQRLHE